MYDATWLSWDGCMVHLDCPPRAAPRRNSIRIGQYLIISVCRLRGPQNDSTVRPAALQGAGEVSGSGTPVTGRCLSCFLPGLTIVQPSTNKCNQIGATPSATANLPLLLVARTSAHLQVYKSHSVCCLHYTTLSCATLDTLISDGVADWLRATQLF